MFTLVPLCIIFLELTTTISYDPTLLSFPLVFVVSALGASKSGLIKLMASPDVNKILYLYSSRPLVSKCERYSVEQVVDGRRMWVMAPM